jgi:hypothetical protein
MRTLKNRIFRGSSMVEQLTVNQLVIGSSPIRGAAKNSKKTVLTEQSFFHLAAPPNITKIN